MPGTEPKETFEQKAERLCQFIYGFLEKKAKSPSHREMCGALQISTETLQKALIDLESQGRIKRVRRRGRQIWMPSNQEPDGEA